MKPNTNKAKNVIIFVGDGMGVQTHTASRIYKGQKMGKSGEDEILEWEKFPYTGQSKTYNTDFQVSMTTLVSDRGQLFTGWRDIPKGKPWAFHFLKNLTKCFLGDVEKGQNLTFKVNFLCQKSTESF